MPLDTKGNAYLLGRGCVTFSRTEKDIERLEYMTSREAGSVGYAVVLTNDSAYWKPAQVGEQVDAEFRIHEGRTLHGALSWGPSTSAGTKGDGDELLNIKGTYALHWLDYSRPIARCWLCDSRRGSISTGALSAMIGRFGYAGGPGLVG